MVSASIVARKRLFRRTWPRCREVGEPEVGKLILDALAVGCGLIENVPGLDVSVGDSAARDVMESLEPATKKTLRLILMIDKDIVEAEAHDRQLCACFLNF